MQARRPDTAGKTTGRPRSKQPPQSLGDDPPTSLLHDLHALSAALSIPRSLRSISSSPPPSDHRHPPNHNNHKLSPSPSPSPSLWKWPRPFKALSHIGHRRFRVRFTLRVHSIRGLPTDINGCCLSVHFRRAGSSSASHTRTVRASRGAADDFHELLEEYCHVYGNKSSPRGPARYEPRQFVVSAVVVGGSKPTALCEHRVDLTSLLPSSLEELEDPGCAGEWSTTFRLGGKGKGATMSVTFGFSIFPSTSVSDRVGSLEGSGRNMEDVVGDGEEWRAVLRRTESLSGMECMSKACANAGMEGKREAAAWMPERVEVMDVDGLGARECDGESCVTSDDVRSRPRDEGVEVTSLVEQEHSGFDEQRKLENVEGRDVDWEKASEAEATMSCGVGRGRCFKNVEFLEVNGSKRLEDVDLVEVDGKKPEGVEVLMVDTPLDKSVGMESAETFILEEVVEDKENEDSKFMVIEQGMEVVGLEQVMVPGGQQCVKVNAAWNDRYVASGEVDKEEVSEEGELLARIKVSEQISDGISEQESQLAGETAIEDLDSAFCGLSIIESLTPVDSPQAKLENSVFHGLSILVSSGHVDSPQAKLENPAADELSILEMSNHVDSPQAKSENTVFDDLSTLELSAPVDSPQAKLEGPVFDELSILESSALVTSPKAKLENSAVEGIPIVESSAPVVSSQAKLDKSVFNGLSVAESSLPLDSPQAKLENLGLPACMEVRSNYKPGRISKSFSFDDVTESVVNEFLTMLGLSSDSDPESPREQLLKQFSKDDAWKQFESTSSSDIESPKERLWRQFKKECSAIGGGILCPDPGSGKESDREEDLDLATMVQAAESEQDKLEQEMISKARAKLLEDAEMEALMREMGLNKKAFQSSPPGSRYGFGSPIDFPHNDPFELPPLAGGLGPCIQTRDGGFLRSMSPSLFRNAKNNGSLIMQASSPIVVPAELGSGVMDILQGLASIGIEKLSMQARKLMPLEDVTGKSMQQVAWEALPSLEGNERLGSDFSRSFTDDGKRKGKSSYSRSEVSGSEFVSIEGLAPLAMDKIEALSIEGLRIQTGMSDGESPANVLAQSLGETSALEGKCAKDRNTLGLEGAAGLQLLDVQNIGDDVDGLMGLSLSLDEWMRLDSGLVDEKDVGSERTTKILAAHHAKSADMVSGGWNKKSGKGSGKRWGLLGNNFTVALMVQLRDPMRDYEPVGTPMLALIQVERVFIPPKPKIYCTISARGNSEEYDEEKPEKKPESKPQLEKKEEEEGAPIPQFKITEVHVAGLKHEPSKKTTWGNRTQQSSGSRWLLATGMGKSNTHPFMKSKAVSKPLHSTTTVQPGNTLWSISSLIHGTGKKWKEPAALNPHVRNPDVIFPNQTIRMR